jgi:uncharacterized membrane protein (DUF2068 family)
MRDHAEPPQDDPHGHYNPDPHAHPGLHVIALFEAGKGVLAWMAASGLALIGPASLQHRVHLLIARFQLDPDHGAMAWLAQAIRPGTVHLAAAIVACYGALHLLEGWGLWRAKAWASWLGCVTAALYLPFDVWAFARHRHWMEAVVVAVNLLVVWVLARDLFKRKR